MPSATKSTIVGALACQKNSFLKTLQTVVVSCIDYVPQLTAKDKQNKNKKVKQNESVVEKSESNKEYAIELEDSVLFPEGGGQPFDTGFIHLANSTSIPVSKVLRDKLTAIHITSTPIEPGTQVTVEVNWNRRIDLMQQHTGQHLLSAVLDTYDLPTLSWSMGETINYIELPKKVDDSIIKEANEKINEIILSSESISVTTPDEHGKEIDTSHIPDDYDLSKGIIRIVKIGDDFDANPCCGTHLQSTSQVQAISLLHQTSVRGGNSRLHFICGSRVYQYLTKQHNILKEIQGDYLSCQLDEVVDKVALLNSNYKKATSRESNLLKELASIEAKSIFTNFEQGKSDFEIIYRSDANPEYLLLFQKEFTTLMNLNKDSDVNVTDKFTIVLINGDYKSGSGGMIKILGPKSETLQVEIKSLVTNLKGGGKGTSFQGKVPKYGKGELESLLSHLEDLKIKH